MLWLILIYGHYLVDYLVDYHVHYHVMITHYYPFPNQALAWVVLCYGQYK